MRKTILSLALAAGISLFPAAVFGGGQSGTPGSGGLQEYGFRESGFPIVSKPYTLKMLTATNSYTPSDMNTMEIFQKLERKTGVHIEWDYAGNDWSTRKPLVLASGDMPDVFFSNALGESDVINNRELFLPLDDLIERYGTNVKAMFNEDPNMLKFARAYDGRIYGLPQKMPYRPTTYATWGINKNWLDKLNLKMPATTEELYQVLKAFKERDPNGNGIADEIPASFRAYIDNRGFLDLFCAFGIFESLNDSWLSVTNGRVQYIAAQEGFQDAVAYLHRLYAEGLIDQESFTQTNQMLFAKTNPPEGQPEIIGLSANWGRTYAFGDRAEHYPLVMPLKGPKGHQGWRVNPELTQSGKYFFEITTACKNPEIAFRWADNLYEELTSLELFYGHVSAAITVNADGTYTHLNAPEGFQGNWSYVYGLNDKAPGYTSDKVSARITDLDNKEQYEDKILLSPYFPKEYYPIVSFSPEESSELSILRTDIHTTTRQQTAAWITSGGVEREYASFLGRIEAMGLKRMLEIYQTAYDRYMGGK